MSRACPLCQSLAAREMKGYERHYVRRCRECSLVYAWRTPSNAELDALYANYPVHEHLSPITRSRYQELLQGFEAHRDLGRILDAGSGVGYFLDVAMEMGWEAHGSEYDPRVVEACRKRGIRMWQGPLTEESFPAGHFDVITSFEVLEHLLDPVHELCLFHRMLRPGGLLYLTTPNFSALGRRIRKDRWSVFNYPEHLNYFTPGTLRRALKDAGFGRVTCQTTGFSISRLKHVQGSADHTEVNHAPANTDQRLRQRIEGNRLLRIGKQAANGLLSLLHAGDTIKMRALRP